MMMSSNGNIFRVTGPLCGEFTSHRWIPRTKAIGAELWCFLWFVPEQTIEQTIETPVIWDAIVLIMTSLLYKSMAFPSCQYYFGYSILIMTGLSSQLFLTNKQRNIKCRVWISNFGIWFSYHAIFKRIITNPIDLFSIKKYIINIHYET